MGTVATAAAQKPAKLTAPCANVRTRITCHQRRRPLLAVRRHTRVTATVTTRTTERLALGMAAIVVGHPLARNTAKSAYAWTPRPRRRQRNPIAVTRHTKVTANATITITRRVAIGTV